MSKTLFALLLASILLVVMPVSAKGPVDRIILTGPTIEGELILTDTAVVHPLSMAMLEDFMAGALDEPADLGDVYYELERQYELPTGEYQTFDRVKYYPSGYVFYMGIENGWSEYDDKWFPAKPEAQMAMATALNEDAAPFVVLMDESGRVTFLDPQSLQETISAQMNSKIGPVNAFVDSVDTSTFYFSEQGADGKLLHHEVSLADQHVCAADTIPESMEERAGIPWVVDGVTWHNAAFKDTPYRAIGVTTDARVLLHYPGQDEADGILVLSMSNSQQIDHWMPGHHFAQVIAGNDDLYALELLPEQATLYRLNAHDGELLGWATVDSGVKWLGYGQFDLSDVGESPVTLHPCTA